MIEYIDRKSGQREVERVYGQKALSFLYGEYFLSKPLLHLVSRIPFFSSFVGFWQSRFFTKRKIAPFIEEHDVDVECVVRHVSGHHVGVEFVGYYERQRQKLNFGRRLKSPGSARCQISLSR